MIYETIELFRYDSSTRSQLRRYHVSGAPSTAIQTRGQMLRPRAAGMSERDAKE